MKLNDYQQAILSVCRVLEPYDSDKLYPVFGFGAKLPAEEGGWSIVQHCFRIDNNQPVNGVQGVLDVILLSPLL